MGWQTAWEPTLEDGSTPSGVRNFRNVIDANTSSYNGTKVRITLKAHSEGSCVVDGCSIGIMETGDDFTYDPASWTADQGVRIKFDSGNDGCTISAGGTKLSDEMTLNFDKTKRYGIHTYQASKANSKYSDSNGHGTYWNSTAVDDTLVQTVSYTSAASWVWLVDKVEVYVEEDININVIEVE